MGVRDFLLRRQREMEEEFLWPDTRAFFAWVRDKVTTPQEATLIFFPWEKKACILVEGKWQKRSPSSLEPSHIRFLLCLPKTLDEAIAIVDIPKGDWFPLFRSPRLEIWESKNRSLQQERPVPLRLGLNDEEKVQVTKEVRRMLGEVLEGKEPVLPASLSERFSEIQSLDVAVWVDGRLRASVIVEGLSCREALARAAWRVPRDDRFKPLTGAELPDALIEITCMSDLLMPVSDSERKRNEIDPTKGYFIRSEKKRGWYLPEVHNVMRFSHLTEFLSSLAIQKAGMDENTLKEADIFQFEVFDWIERNTEEKKTGPLLTLSGPVSVPGQNDGWEERMKSVLRSAVHWLGAIQESDGNIPPIFSPKAGVTKDLNWAALGCTAHALAFYGRSLQEEKAISIAEKACNYLNASEALLRENNHWLALVYLVRLKFALGKPVSDDRIREIAAASSCFLADPIGALQKLSLLAEWEEQGHTDYGAWLRKETEALYLLFERVREKEEVQLAFYPELVAVCEKLWHLTEEESWKDKALRISRWYAEKQGENGDFPHSPGRIFSYTRGTGKIFEALACFPEENEITLGRTFLWLETMQYAPENIFWMPPEKKPVFLGAFRHDAFNQEAWIDGAAHIILGCARWLQYLKKNKELS